MASHIRNDYKHVKLAYADSIRLLELLPGPKGSPLACNIFEVRKHDNPEYEALSYAWGEPVFSHVVQEVSSGTEIHVTKNLEQALQGIRYEHVARILWADAICINQSDLKEKGHQVALMGQIYRDAKRVVVWLGCQHVAPDRMIGLLNELIEACEGFDENDSSSRQRFRTVMTRLDILQIFEQPWYSRVWVVQEFVLARDIQLIAGNTIIPLELFQTALMSLLKTASNPQILISGAQASLNKLYAPATHIHQLLAYRERRLSQRRSGCKEYEISLAPCVVHLATGKHCKDPRDRLYAMLALADDRLGIEPDYTLTAFDLFKDFAIRSLSKGELMLLHVSGIRPDSEVDSSSFVPNLHPTYFTTLPLNVPELGFSASTGSPVTIEVMDANAIMIRGVRVDTITCCFNDQQVPEMNLSHSSNNSWKYSFWELPRWTVSITQTRPWPYKDSTLRDIYECLMTLRVENPSPTTGYIKERVAQQYLNNRFIFQTRQGYFGIGPLWMRPDDQVVIFDGGATPFILRNVSTMNRWGTPRWQLVGDCYLLGWMDGSLFGHTVVDKLPPGDMYDEMAAGKDENKCLVRESFVLC